jgi:hypothetical protein
MKPHIPQMTLIRGAHKRKLYIILQKFLHVKLSQTWKHSSTFFDLCTGWWWVVRFTPLLLYLWERTPSTHSVGEPGWAPESVWMLWGREKSCSARNWTQAFQPVACLCIDWAVPTFWIFAQVIRNRSDHKILSHGLVNQFIGYSQVITTIHYNTLNITIIIT